MLQGLKIYEESVTFGKNRQFKWAYRACISVRIFHVRHLSHTTVHLVSEFRKYLSAECKMFGEANVIIVTISSLCVCDGLHVDCAVLNVCIQMCKYHFFYPDSTLTWRHSLLFVEFSMSAVKLRLFSRLIHLGNQTVLLKQSDNMNTPGEGNAVEKNSRFKLWFFYLVAGICGLPVTFSSSGEHVRNVIW